MDRRKESELLGKRALQVQRGAARAAVLGVNDGLVSVLCLVLAVAAAGAQPAAVLLAGFAGLLAGAISMAAGEWISVRAQAELFGGVLKDIEGLVKEDRELLGSQLANQLQVSGYTQQTASAAIKDILQDNRRLRDTYARQVMGFNPDELGSPWIAAISSFVLFTVGALAPLLPWMFGSGSLAIMLSIIFTSLASLIIGGYIATSSGKSVIYGALRQLAIVALASIITYGVGYLFGVSVG
jgi:VIT1/CCC1 family predicted Fe2+/Mn2+ transporter